MRLDHSAAPNAFLHPNNALAVFPQHKKPNIMDFRVEKMELGGYTAVGVYRKGYQKNAKKSKYATIAKTTADLEREMLEKELAAQNQMQMDTEPVAKNTRSNSMNKDDGPTVVVSSKPATVDEIQKMTEALDLSKKKKAPQIQIRSKGISKWDKKK